MLSYIKSILNFDRIFPKSHSAENKNSYANSYAKCTKTRINRCARALLAADLDAMHLSLLPIEIGLKSPSSFTRAISFAQKKKSLSCFGTLPSPIRFRSLISGFKKLSPALPFDLLIRSLKICVKNFTGRAPEPFGTDIIALYTSITVTKNLSTFSGRGAFISALFGCYGTNFL